MRRLITAKMQKNIIAKRMIKQASLNDILVNTDEDAIKLITKWYNANQDMAAFMQILSDGGYHFTKDFENDVTQNYLVWSNDINKFLSQDCNPYSENKSPSKELTQFSEDWAKNLPMGEGGDFKEQFKNWDIKDIRKYISNYIDKGNMDYLKDSNVKDTLLNWFDKNIQNTGNFEYLFSYLMKDSDALNTIIDAIPDENFESVSAGKENWGALLKSNDFVGDLSKQFRIYQSPDGIAVFKK